MGEKVHHSSYWWLWIKRWRQHLRLQPCKHATIFTLSNITWLMWKHRIYEHINRTMWSRIDQFHVYITLTKARVNCIQWPVIVYIILLCWTLYTMTGYCIQCPIYHIDRNIYIGDYVSWRLIKELKFERGCFLRKRKIDKQLFSSLV